LWIRSLSFPSEIVLHSENEQRLSAGIGEVPRKAELNSIALMDIGHEMSPLFSLDLLPNFLLIYEE
jgi:hypothetical protein